MSIHHVKLTVNFDDPPAFTPASSTGPARFSPFLPWPDDFRGRQGTGQVGTVSLAIAPASLGYRIERLVRHGVVLELVATPHGAMGEPS